MDLSTKRLKLQSAISIENAGYYHTVYKYTSFTRLNDIGKMNGPRRVIAFCLLTAVLPTLLIIIPLYLRHSVFADVLYQVAESDIFEIEQGMSTVFCQEHVLEMNTSFSAYQISGQPEMSGNRKHIRLKKSMVLPDDTLEYWGFYLLRGATVALKACSRYHGSRILVVRGEKNLRTCGLLQHNVNKPHLDKEHKQVTVTFETAAQEILDSKESFNLEMVPHEDLPNRINKTREDEDDLNTAAEERAADDEKEDDDEDDEVRQMKENIEKFINKRRGNKTNEEKVSHAKRHARRRHYHHEFKQKHGAEEHLHRRKRQATETNQMHQYLRQTQLRRIRDELDDKNKEAKIHELQDALTEDFQGYSHEEQVRKLREELDEESHLYIRDEQLRKLRDDLEREDASVAVRNGLEEEFEINVREDKMRKIRDEFDRESDRYIRDEQLRKLRDELEREDDEIRKNQQLKKGKRQSLSKHKYVRDKQLRKIRNELEHEDELRRFREELNEDLKRYKNKDEVNELRDELGGEVHKYIREQQLREIRDELEREDQVQEDIQKASRQKIMRRLQVSRRNKRAAVAAAAVTEAAISDKLRGETDQKSHKFIREEHLKKIWEELEREDQIRILQDALDDGLKKSEYENQIRKLRSELDEESHKNIREKQLREIHDELEREDSIQDNKIRSDLPSKKRRVKRATETEFNGNEQEDEIRKLEEDVNEELHKYIREKQLRQIWEELKKEDKLRNRQEAKHKKKRKSTEEDLQRYKRFATRYEDLIKKELEQKFRELNKDSLASNHRSPCNSAKSSENPQNREDTLKNLHSRYEELIKKELIQKYHELNKDPAGNKRETHHDKVRKLRDILFQQNGHRKKRETGHKLDGAIEHGGNAINYTKVQSGESTSVSSFETNLLECYDGRILLTESFPSSNLCSNVHYLTSRGNHMQLTHNVATDGYYYYIFYSDNDLVSNDIHAIFDIKKPSFQYSNLSDTKKCLNSTECNFPVSFFSNERVIVEVPTRDGIEHEEDDITLLVSKCKPRVGVYIIFPIAILFLILGCAFL